MNSDHKPTQKPDMVKTISLHERTAIKLFPIIEEVLKTLAPESTNFEYLHMGDRQEEADMRSILGFLN